MQAESRRLFNDAFDSQSLYQRYVDDLVRRCGTTFDFRLAETPVFLDDDLRTQIATAAREIVAQLSEPTRLERMREAVPARWDTPGIDSLPSFTQVDFAIVRDSSGRLVPRLIELQGFPSLTSLEVLQRDSWQEVLRTVPGLDREWSCWFDHDRAEFLELARRTICGTHDPADVVMLDLEPETQKTYPDFAATRLLFGVDSLDPRKLVKRGNQLWRTDDQGRERRVRRIYNRIVFDELEQKNIALPYDYRDELDVEWTPHPNWYWIWSKNSIPYLDHPAVPRAQFLSDVVELPADLSSKYVLKPLFSFAGGGVNVEPTTADVAAIPQDDRRHWCLQEKIDYEPALIAVDGGGVKVEVRTMFLKPDDEPTPILAQNLCRLSRGKMLGVDFNKDFTWVGGTVGIWPADAGNDES